MTSYRGYESEPGSPSFYSAATHLTPPNMSGMSGASVYGTPRLVRVTRPPPEPRSPSFVFQDEDSVYDDTYIADRLQEKYKGKIFIYLTEVLRLPINLIFNIYVFKRFVFKDITTTISLKL